jgi:hypothetical protein
MRELYFVLIFTPSPPALSPKGARGLFVPGV